MVLLKKINILFDVVHSAYLLFVMFYEVSTANFFFKLTMKPRGVFKALINFDKTLAKYTLLHYLLQKKVVKIFHANFCLRVGS